MQFESYFTLLITIMLRASIVCLFCYRTSVSETILFDAMQMAIIVCHLPHFLWYLGTVSSKHLKFHSVFVKFNFTQFSCIWNWQNFSADLSDLDGSVDQRRQEIGYSSSSDSPDLPEYKRMPGLLIFSGFSKNNDGIFTLWNLKTVLLNVPKY